MDAETIRKYEGQRVQLKYHARKYPDMIHTQIGVIESVHKNFTMFRGMSVLYSQIKGIKPIK